MRNTELYHDGTIGMKWGVRKYQYEDGTYTEEGKRRRRKGKYSREELQAMSNRAFDQSIKGGKDKPNKSPVEVMLKSTTDASSSIKNIINRYRPKNNEDLSNYSDEDLRKYINRKNLEKQYRDLSDADIQSGHDKVTEVIDTLGDVLGIASSAILIYTMANKIKNGG